MRRSRTSGNRDFPASGNTDRGVRACGVRRFANRIGRSTGTTPSEGLSSCNSRRDQAAIRVAQMLAPTPRCLPAPQREKLFSSIAYIHSRLRRHRACVGAEQGGHYFVFFDHTIVTATARRRLLPDLIDVAYISGGFHTQHTAIQPIAHACARTPGYNNRVQYRYKRDCCVGIGTTWSPWTD